MPGVIEPKPQPPAHDRPARDPALFLSLIARAADLPAALVGQPSPSASSSLVGRASQPADVALVGRASQPASSPPPGLEPHTPARTVLAGPLAAVVSDIDAADFTGDASERHLADLEWLAPRAARHEALIESCRHPADGHAVPVLPARFGTIFRAESSIAARLAAHEGTILAFLDAVTARDEWTVRIVADRARATDRLVQATACARGLNLASGAGYLLARKLQADAAARVSDWLLERSMHTLGTLPPGPRRLITRAPARRAEGPEPVALAAVLATPTEAADLLAWADAARPALADDGLSIDVTGPWPPYSFCPNLDAPAEAAPCPAH